LSVHEAKKIDALAKKMQGKDKVPSSTTQTKGGRKKVVKEKVYDLWDEGEATIPQQTNKNKEKKHVVYKPVAPSVLPLSKPEHPGQSYNPSLDDHQELLKKVRR